MITLDKDKRNVEAAVTGSQNPFPKLDMHEARRTFLKGIGAGSIGAAVFGAAEGSFTEAYAQSVNDISVLNFALNLEYLEASFYLYSVTGQGLSASDMGTNPGSVVGGALVPFASPTVRSYAVEIAVQERTHVQFLRSALGGQAAPMPNLNIGTGLNDAFTQIAVAAGVIARGQTFNAYANDLNFLLASYIFEDVGVTAYNGGSALLTVPAYLTAAAGILAVEAYHSGIIRTTLFNMAQTNQQVANITSAISQTRSALANNGNPNVDDYGIGSISSPHIAVGDSGSRAFARNTTQVLNIVYGNTGLVGRGGLFFPNGMNGVVR